MKNPATCIIFSSVKEFVRFSNHDGDNVTPASVTAMISLCAASIATFLPVDILAPSYTSILKGNLLEYLDNIVTVLSFEPASHTMISSGKRVCNNTESNRRCIWSASLSTVITRQMFMQEIIY